MRSPKKPFLAPPYEWVAPKWMIRPIGSRLSSAALKYCPPRLSSITGLRIRNSRERVGGFASSDQMLNRVYNATVSAWAPEFWG